MVYRCCTDTQTDATKYVVSQLCNRNDILKNKLDLSGPDKSGSVKQSTKLIDLKWRHWLSIKIQT